MPAKNTFKINFKSFQKLSLAAIFSYTVLASTFGICEESIVKFDNNSKGFSFVKNGKAVAIYLDNVEYEGIQELAGIFADDIERVSAHKPSVSAGKPLKSKKIIFIGTIGKSTSIDNWIAQGKINVDKVKGKWESTIIQIIQKPFPGVDQALVIAGSDKRGTIYGMFEISRQMGVSPWYWWADVEIQKHQNIVITPGIHQLGEPLVQYRGIFLNDEQPALGGWAFEKFGGFNHKFYEKLFELMIRLKSNYLWPAMWGQAFADDDSLSAGLADKWGIVMGTSHHEPMMRAHDEWRRYGSGPWNYDKNPEKLDSFWNIGINRTKNYEKIVTVGMRGDGDEPMSEESNIELLKRIVNHQRNILKTVTGKNPSEIPQVWALYKEVQEYYDKGMEVPDDITLLLCDDNWGNIRRLPNMEDSARNGGYGIYYHYDYVGGPRNYKWINTNQISRVWEQMNLAYQYGANKIWIVNVGDLKPMEYPMQFFLDYAWNPLKIKAENLPEYSIEWSRQQFGKEFDTDIAQLITLYSTYNSRRKPELLNAETYSLISFNEWETVVGDYNYLVSKATKIYENIPASSKDAYYQLVLYPILASANLNELYYKVAKNHLYAQQGRSFTNALADTCKILFAKDSILSYKFNNELSQGKWRHFMDQTHIGYTSWQQPAKDSMPKVKYLSSLPNSILKMAIEGSVETWPGSTKPAILPAMDNLNQQNRVFELFTTGNELKSFAICSSETWISISPDTGKFTGNQRITVKPNWDLVPKGKTKAKIYVFANSSDTLSVQLDLFKHSTEDYKNFIGFVESNNYISIEAPHYSKSVTTGETSWVLIPDLGKTFSAMTIMPVTHPTENTFLQYNFTTDYTGNINIDVYLSPTLNFNNSEGLRFGISIDDQEPTILNMHEGETNDTWYNLVANNIRIITTEKKLVSSGNHQLKFWAIDPGVVLQKLVIKTGPIPYSYLGPPESYFVK